MAAAAEPRQSLFVADQSWRGTSGARATACEDDDYGFLLEPGFWLMILVACMPIAAGCVYLLLTDG
ncbi:hypothetical protein [Rhodopseudomonas telluris]|uniref:Uncharacterized protein n=1 Tax=Rhodopseudomonas telluris TaxID=644215 RepID=A0ABV6EL57_9BRAD